MSDNKIAVVIYEPASGDLSRVFRGLKVASEFKSAGDDVVVVFDGSGVESLGALSEADHKLHPLLESLRDNVHGACAYCANGHGVKDQIEAAGYALKGDADGEVSIRNLVTDGRQILNY
ncbi:DsrE family protein [Demequina globuliformis]|uniref:DsrE family protein n=1 Tax=Demequina globuliformis TaxID=676202 RepID=UPI000B246A85|nr:DsrE family protein [Demequina globuliformis]